MALGRLCSKIHFIDNKKDATDNLQDIPPKFIWNSTSQFKFKSQLPSEPVKAKFESVSENTRANSAEIVNKLTEILLSCAETSGLKSRRKRKGRLLDKSYLIGYGKVKQHTKTT